VASILVDSGPLIALFDADDRWHLRVKSFLRSYRGELATSAACVTEAAWLTSSLAPACFDGLAAWLARGSVAIHNIEFADLARIRQLAAKYRDLDPDFADLALLALAERLETLSVLTVDARDYSIYRLRSGKRLVNLLDERA
jgi:predicted nucleic acid-binding protein